MTASESVEERRELRAENSRGYAERGINHGCLFDSDYDGNIPEGYGCGGCGCHMSAPCGHCLGHLEPEEGEYISTMLGLQGRGTR